MLNLTKSEREIVFKKIVESFQKGYFITASINPDKIPSEDQASSKNAIFGLVSCKKLRIGETLTNLIKILNPEKFEFKDNLWGPNGSSWNIKLKKELRYFTEVQRNNVEWIDLQSFTSFFSTINIYRINPMDKTTQFSLPFSVAQDKQALLYDLEYFSPGRVHRKVKKSDSSSSSSSGHSNNENSNPSSDENTSPEQTPESSPVVVKDSSIPDWALGLKKTSPAKPAVVRPKDASLFKNWIIKLTVDKPGTYNISCNQLDKFLLA
jgi:hypothetical protein